MTTQSPLRSIIHADLDAFYASVEQMDRPELRGRPVVVGGSAEGRGVVAAASYEARRFGIHSAMPMARALRLCPQAIRVSPRFDRYHELSQGVFGYYRELTPLVETLALDEAYLDVTVAAGSWAGAQQLGAALKRTVRDRTGLTVSVGVATSKLVAKVASDHGKPDGFVAVPPGGEAGFLAPLPVRVLWGVGPKAEEALGAHGITTVAQLLAAPLERLAAIAGTRAAALQGMARGIDHRTVETHREAKSIGAERTFASDLPDGPELRDALARVATEVGRRIERHGLLAATLTLKLRYAGFRTITRQAPLAPPAADAAALLAAAEALLDAAAQPGDRFRLIGLTGSRFLEPGGPEQPRQLALWPDFAFTG